MARISQTDKGLHARAVITGLRKRLERGRTHRMGGKDYTREAIIAAFQRQLDALDAIRVARAQLAAAVRAERAIARAAKPLVCDLKFYLANEFGDDAVVFADFG